MDNKPTTLVLERPAIIADAHLEYLDRLRESGVTNMLQAWEYLEDSFGVNHGEACIIISYWINTFGFPNR